MSGILRAGDQYEVRNVNDYYGAPVASGTYGGGAISLPTAGVTPRVPVGGWSVTPPTTGPDFNAYVVIKQ